MWPSRCGGKEEGDARTSTAAAATQEDRTSAPVQSAHRRPTEGAAARWPAVGPRTRGGDGHEWKMQRQPQRQSSRRRASIEGMRLDAISERQHAGPVTGQRRCSGRGADTCTRPARDHSNRLPSTTDRTRVMKSRSEARSRDFQISKNQTTSIMITFATIGGTRITSSARAPASCMS